MRWGKHSQKKQGQSPTSIGTETAPIPSTPHRQGATNPVIQIHWDTVNDLRVITISACADKTILFISDGKYSITTLLQFINWLIFSI